MNSPLLKIKTESGVYEYAGATQHGATMALNSKTGMRQKVARGYVVVSFRQMAGGDELPSNPSVTIPNTTVKQWSDFMQEQLVRARNGVVDLTSPEFKRFMTQAPAQKSRLRGRELAL